MWLIHLEEISELHPYVEHWVFPSGCQDYHLFKKKAIAMFIWHFYKELILVPASFTKNTLLILTHSCLQHQINLVARASTFDNFSCLFLKIVGIGAFTRVPRGARLSSTSTIQLLSYLGIVWCFVFLVPMTTALLVFPATATLITSPGSAVFLFL